MMRHSLALWMGVVLAGSAAADAEQVVKEQLDKLKATGARVIVLKDDALARTFPGIDFVAVLFPQFPVARPAPDPLKPSNVYAVARDGKATLLNDGKTMQAFLTARQYDAKEAALKDLLRSWLRLSSQLAQDGFYQFKIEEDSIKVSGGKVVGRIVVVDGGVGEIVGTLEVKDGMLDEWNAQSKLRPGGRPRVQ